MHKQRDSITHCEVTLNNKIYLFFSNKKKMLPQKSFKINLSKHDERDPFHQNGICTCRVGWGHKIRFTTPAQAKTFPEMATLVSLVFPFHVSSANDLNVGARSGATFDQNWSVDQISYHVDSSQQKHPRPLMLSHILFAWARAGVGSLSLTLSPVVSSLIFIRNLSASCAHHLIIRPCQALFMSGPTSSVFKFRPCFGFYRDILISPHVGWIGAKVTSNLGFSNKFVDVFQIHKIS